MLRILLTSFLFVYSLQATILQQYDEQTIQHILETEIPDLEIQSVTLISSGWDNLVADVNNQWIFRFPRTTTFLETLERERKLLDQLHLHVTLPIPYYQFTGTYTDFVGYQKIQGIELDDELYLSLPESKKQEIANTFAQFITEMHNSVTAEQAREWGYPDYNISRAWIESSLLNTLPDDINTLILEALNFPQKEPQLVLIHNDLHGGNIAINPITHEISGIFDFSDAVIADYTIEFGKLFNIHPDLAYRAGKIYAAQNQVEDPTPYAAADFILRRSVYILLARENGDRKREAVLIKMLNDFLPVWKKLHLSEQFYHFSAAISEDAVDVVVNF